MKLIALFAAGALATGAVAASPADAQYRGGWHGGSHGHGGGYYGHRGYNRGGYGWRGGYARGRVICRIHRGYYGPVRRCVRVYR